MTTVLQGWLLLHWVLEGRELFAIIRSTTVIGGIILLRPCCGFRHALIILFFVLFILPSQGCNDVSDDEAFRRGVNYAENEEYEKAFSELHSVAENGNATAQYFVGSFYRLGLGVSKDMKKAVALLEKSASGGWVASMVALSDIYRRGEGVDKDCSRHIYWTKKASEAGNTYADFRMFNNYLSGNCVEVNTIISEKYCYKASLSDDEYGMLCKALCFYYGIKRDVDYRKSRLLFEEANKKYNNSYAKSRLGVMYLKGFGVEPDYMTAINYLQLASKQKSIVADALLANVYYGGDYVGKDYGKAYHYAKRSADKVANSAFIVGNMYEYGHGVEKDSDTALQWYKKALKMGSSEANAAISRLNKDN